MVNCRSLWRPGPHLAVALTLPSVKHVNTYLDKYKNSFDSSKVRFYTKILSQFSKLWDKKRFGGPFLLTMHMHLYMQVLLTVPFAVFADGCIYFSWEINRVSKSFQVVNIKNACFLELDSIFAFWNSICWSLKYSSVFISSRNAY